MAQLIEQARVLDRDDGLTGEVCDQLDLLLGEWPDFGAIDCNAADRLILPEHRHGDQCADAGDFDAVDRHWIAVEVGSTLCKVRNLDRLSGLDGANRRGFRVEMDQGSLPPSLRVSRRQGTVEGAGAELVSFAQPQDAVTGLA